MTAEGNLNKPKLFKKYIKGIFSTKTDIIITALLPQFWKNIK